MEHPDAKKHQLVSFAKSGIRIGGCIMTMITGSAGGLAFALLLAELVGIYEELV